MSAAIAYLALVAFAILMMVFYVFSPQIDRLITYLESKGVQDEDMG
ncbi:hypothetical protein [Caldimonas sp. KR1-144]